METERKEMTSVMVVNSKCSNCFCILSLHLPVPEVLAKVREDNVKLTQMVQKLPVEKAQLDAQLEAVKEVKLKEQKEKKQAREKRKKKSMEKQVLKGKTRPKGQTTLDGMGWVKQVAKLDRSKTGEGSDKKRLGVESLVNKASEGHCDMDVSSTQADSKTHKLMERTRKNLTVKLPPSAGHC